MKAYYDWSAYQDAGMGDAYADIPKSGGNFAKAVAVCINSGQCQQTERGVMCPSYRISQRPELSTGGRVKLLKAALNGELGDAALADPDLALAMDLCVSCKGCKRECESSVDMALIKAEYLAQRFAKGVPLRSRLFATMPQMLAAWPLLRPVIKWRNRSSWLRRLGQRWLGVDAGVAWPEPATRKLTLNDCRSANNQETIVLFVDSLNRYFNPQVAESAYRVLVKAGYGIIVLRPPVTDKSPKRPLCCGRTYITNGMADEARAQARRLLQALAPHLQAGRRIVGLEPSCVLMLRDEYLHLGLGTAAEELAKQVMLFEEFIAKEQAAKRWSLTFKADALADRYLVHGHCHQKAVGATKAMRKVIKMIPETDGQLIESSCCGMAGQFGYEAEHGEYAKQMAELGLFPALRQEPHTQVIANGFSCQQQIVNGGFAKPLHIAEILDAAL